LDKTEINNKGEQLLKMLGQIYKEKLGEENLFNGTLPYFYVHNRNKLFPSFLIKDTQGVSHQ
jgi:hypothetical protein